jgi:hypothetical protein
MRVRGRYKFLHAEEDVGRNRPYPELESLAGDRSAIARRDKHQRLPPNTQVAHDELGQLSRIS